MSEYFLCWKCNEFTSHPKKPSAVFEYMLRPMMSLMPDGWTAMCVIIIFLAIFGSVWLRNLCRPSTTQLVTHFWTASVRSNVTISPVRSRVIGTGFWTNWTSNEIANCDLRLLKNRMGWNLFGVWAQMERHCSSSQNPTASMSLTEWV